MKWAQYDQSWSSKIWSFKNNCAGLVNQHCKFSSNFKFYGVLYAGLSHNISFWFSFIIFPFGIENICSELHFSWEISGCEFEVLKGMQISSE